MSSFLVGLLGALSANAVGAAIGALIGGYLTDRFGRKLIYTYNMLLYMLGCLIVILAFNPIMLFIGFITLGISVGAGVPASWSYISETSDSKNRGSNIGLSQLFWALGPTFVFIVATITSPLGLLENRIVFLMLLIVAFVAWLLQRQLQESQAWQDDNKGQAIKHNSYRELLTNKINLKNILFLVSVYLFWNLVASSSGFFMPFVYSSVGHISYSYTQVISAIAGIVNALAAYFIFGRL
ncbi:major facilitator transporter [Lactobacillus sakei subsp. sakei DSM = JCM 1157] [Lactiplantibacillus mudanjiangensis]|uniref:MFS transporter n=1 Tax=Lactiplantibacillus mudanjiangensis TaxID=1296538 RepID=UPI0010159FDD|nr:major facilitator transporter [Lactobacillus sakei subsp. sakei DSM = JCM 1157] [Lactiplantibacillus mudanjiangensis]